MVFSLIVEFWNYIAYYVNYSRFMYLSFKMDRVTDLMDAQKPADWADAARRLRRIRWLLS